MPGIILVTPTYNEKLNLERLAKQIFFLGIPNLKMIVVDDNSPDGTADVALALAKKYPIEVIRRAKKLGLGAAYVEAFRRALEHKPDYIIQMDADLSHDPKVIPELLEKINPSTGSGQETYDLVLGSRYVEGGKIENWDYARQLVSKFGNIYARAVLGLPYKDLTGGFKCWRRSALEKIDFNALSSQGYNFQIETTHKAHLAGHKICEIPITFTERKEGVSKFSPAIILEAFWKVLLLRFFK